MKLPRLSSSPISCWATLIALFCLTTDAGAMVVVQRDFPDLVQRAEQIVSGTVVDIGETRIDGSPVTLVTVSELTVMKGAVGDSITLEIYGGTDGEYAIKVPDMPTFTVGERVLLFVAGNGKNVCPLVGVWQGAFRVDFDEASGTDTVSSYSGAPIAGVVNGKVQHAGSRGDGGAAGAALTLDGFRRLIADELARSGSSPGESR